MTRAGVSEDVIVTHVRNHGLVQPLQANDLIALQQQGVSPRVVQAMQAPPAVSGPQPMAAPYPYPGPGYYPYPPPYPYPYPNPYYYGPYRPAVGWGVAIRG